jgi:hypothetical protein
MPVETNREIARVDYPGNVGENDAALPSTPDSSGCGVFRFNRGPVAQLGARFHGMEEVVGSIPTRSTKSINNLVAPVAASTGQHCVNLLSLSPQIEGRAPLSLS